MMLDVAGLPKNSNGFRTTHTCELCGFEPKTKNKYREKQDHLVMKHFKEKIDKIFPHCRPYACPAEDCVFAGKDKQALLRHYTGKHGILDKYLREALAERGIHYNPGEGGKRRSSANSDSSGNGNSRGGKNPRLSVSPPQGIVQISPNTPVAMTIVDGAANHNGAAAITLNGNKVNGVETVLPGSAPVGTKITLAHKPNTEELRKEVEAMMASFQPVEQPVVLHIPNGVTSVTGTVNGGANKSLVTTAKAGQVINGIPAGVTQVVTAIPVMNSSNPTANGGTIVASGPPTAASAASAGSTNGGTTVVNNGVSNVRPITSLPAIVLSAVASASIASAMEKTKIQQQQQQQQQSLPSLLGNGNAVVATSASLVTANGQVALANGNGIAATAVDTVTAPGQKQATSVPTITVNAPIVSSTANGSSVHIAPAAVSSSPAIQTVLPPIKTVTSSTGPLQQQLQQQPQQQQQNGVAAAIGSLSTSNPLPIEIIAKNGLSAAASGRDSKLEALVTEVVENEDVMWSASANGPAVIVESANAVPISYVDVSCGDVANGNVNVASVNGATTAFTTANLENIEYDYLYQVGATGNGAGGIEVRERQLDFCML